MAKIYDYDKFISEISYVIRTSNNCPTTFNVSWNRKTPNKSINPSSPTAIWITGSSLNKRVNGFITLFRFTRNSKLYFSSASVGSAVRCLNIPSI